MTQQVRTTTSNTFHSDVSAASRPVLVDFYADWCAPCKALAPIVEEVAADFVDRIDAVKVNVDEEPELASRFGIRGIPALLLFKEGEAVETLVGVTSRVNLENTITPHL